MFSGSSFLIKAFMSIPEVYLRSYKHDTSEIMWPQEKKTFYLKIALIIMNVNPYCIVIRQCNSVLDVCVCKYFW